ncbi:hypothetical protein HN903_02270 [archaeon]|jgi:hypothetical protein|nr:hypothetical protein [archaeon]MBT7128558.1 hypothetical protein [archaeon]
MKGKYDITPLGEIHNFTAKKEYVAPEYKLETTMTFQYDALKNQDTKYTCRQCSSCHGCR